MARSLFIGFQILGLLLFTLGQREEVKIEHNPPILMAPGEEALVTVEFDKSDVKGFAKYQINVSEGITLEVVESAGASFTFNNGKGKFIWMALPVNEEFSISYRVIANENAYGAKSMDCRFSYIYENERKNSDLPKHIINIGEGEVLMADNGEEPLLPTTSIQDTYASGERTIASEGVNQWRVTLELQKNGLTGFAKVEENIPEGYTAIDLKSSGAVFNSMDNVIKYIWYDIPESNKIILSYKLLPVMLTGGDEPNINGTFSYLVGEETTEIPIISSIDLMVENQPRDTAGAEVIGTTDSELANVPEISPEPLEEDRSEIVPIETTLTANLKGETSAEEDILEKNEIAEEKREPIVASKEKEPKTVLSSNLIDVPNPETGVFYRVQIAAGKSNVKKSDFEKLYTFNEGYNLENHDGWFKYTTGYHEVYKSARDDRKRISTEYDKFQGPFVTAYNDGARISVQEALMVTTQKWYP
ncbi:MAG: hypothetical protein MK086_03005 [Flavobacteriales bacterium]|nr:hypothetical protein [Flavobacteriales bacterium]